jgi:hypothetical protein
MHVSSFFFFQETYPLVGIVEDGQVTQLERTVTYKVEVKRLADPIQITKDNEMVMETLPGFPKRQGGRDCLRAGDGFRVVQLKFVCAFFSC